MICPSCEILTIDRLYTRGREPVNTRDRTTWNRNGYLELHSSYQSLQRAARNGCTNCLSFHEKFLTLDGGFKSLAKRLAVLAGSQGSPVPIIAYLDFGTKISIKGKSLIANLNLQVGTEIANPGVNPLISTFKIIRPRSYCSRPSNCSIYKS
jgi:AhpD family alkylhydroperoxidase